MPTYRNDSTETKAIENISGVLVNVAPTQTVETYNFLGTGWTQTLATPYWNPILSETAVTLDTVGVEVSFDPVQCKSFVILDISDIVTHVYLEAIANTPLAFSNIRSTSGYIPKYDNSAARVRKIVLKGSGTCKVVAYR